jgi:hypothetical protein
MLFELWDYDTRNIIYTYRSESEALAEVAAQIAEFGRDAVKTWLLLSNDGTQTEDGLQRIADGDDLADLALQAMALGNA